MTLIGSRNGVLKCVFAAMVLAAGLLTSPQLTRDAYAALGGCSVRCPDGSSCSGDPGAGERCSCTCSFWGSKTSVCTCQALRENVPG